MNALTVLSTLLDFLDQPAVAIRVAERDETFVVGPPGIEVRGLSFRSEVERLTYIIGSTLAARKPAHAWQLSSQLSKPAGDSAFRFVTTWALSFRA